MPLCVPPWGGGTPRSSLIPRLSAGLARRASAREQKGVSAGQPEPGSRRRRCWGFGHPAPSLGLRGPAAFPATARARGASPVVPISGFSGALEPAGPLTRALACRRAPSRGDEERGNPARAWLLGRVCWPPPAPPASRRCLPGEGPCPLPSRSSGHNTPRASAAMVRAVGSAGKQVLFG